jgi:hypothetical protein
MCRRFLDALPTYIFGQVSKIVLALKHAEWDIRVEFDPMASAQRECLWLHSPDGNPRFVPLNRQSASSLL